VVNRHSSPATWATAIALALGCRSQGGAGAAEPGPPDRPERYDRSCLPPEKAAPMSSTSSASPPPPFVGPPSIVPWSRLPGVRTVDVAAATGGALELPGPRTRPVRPWLELAGSPAGVAARLVQADGAVAALALHGDQVVPIGAGALAVSARRDGLWVLYRDQLVHHDLAGVERLRLPLTAVAMLGAAGDAVWLASGDRAWHVDAAGAVRGPYPWAQPLGSFAAGEQLCARDKRDARSLHCLAPDGARAPRPLPFELLPLEQPIALDGERVVTLQGTTARVYVGAELAAAAAFQVAGVDAAGRGFTVAAEASGVTLWQQATAAGGAPEPRRFPRVGPGSLSAAAVNGEQVSLYGQGQVALHGGGAAGEVATIDEVAYRDAIFPTAWILSPRAAFAAAPGGALMLAASGPTGVALLPLSLGR
jgi:hypothetical protein